MKKSLSFNSKYILVFSTILLLSACKKDDDNGSTTTTTPTLKEKISGTWTGVTDDNTFQAFGLTFTFPTDISTTTVEFNSGASYKETIDTDVTFGTWTTAGSNRIVINGLVYNVELINSTDLHYSTQTSLDTLGTTVTLTTIRKLTR